MKSKQPKNILFVLDNLLIGGAQKHVLDIIRLMDPQKFRPVVCTLFSVKGPSFVKSFSELKVPLYELKMNSWRDRVTISEFRDILRKEKIDLVHGHMVPADYWGCLLGKMFGKCKTIYTRHNTYTYDSQLRMALLNYVIADRIISISDCIIHNLVNEYRAPKRRLRKINNGVDIDLFTPAHSREDFRLEFDIRSDTIVIANASRFEPRKGYDIFLKVAKRVCRSVPNVKFLAIGHGELKDDIIRWSIEHKLTENILLIEPRHDMPRVMAAIDVLLFTPYWGEGLPYVVLEAMASGKPVVASNIGSNREIIIDGETGFLPDPSKWVHEIDKLLAEAFTSKILHLIKHPDLMAEMGKRSRQRIEAQFSLQQMISKLESVYTELLDE